MGIIIIHLPVYTFLYTVGYTQSYCHIYYYHFYVYLKVVITYCICEHLNAKKTQFSIANMMRLSLSNIKLKKRREKKQNFIKEIACLTHFLSKYRFALVEIYRFNVLCGMTPNTSVTIIFLSIQ